jgi:uncharacterized protein YbaP (TraB family)
MIIIQQKSIPGIFIVAFLLLLSFEGFSQPTSAENTIFWKVSGNGLSEPSYLFGTHHLLTNSFVDTIPAVMNAFQNADMVAGELIIDSTLEAPMMEAALLQGISLHELLPDTLYKKAECWFMNEAGMELSNLDQLNPIMVSTIAMGIIQRKYFPNPEGEVQMDSYFQEKAKADGKQLVGLETIEVQINALFKQVSLARQVEIMIESFYSKIDVKEAMSTMKKEYCSGDLSALQDLMYGSIYKPEEMKVLLDDRNRSWVKKLTELMKDQSVFVAVGALHLPGPTGLVRLLRELGYDVTPIRLT